MGFRLLSRGNIGNTIEKIVRVPILRNLMLHLYGFYSVSHRELFRFKQRSNVYLFFFSTNKRVYSFLKLNSIHSLGKFKTTQKKNKEKTWRKYEKLYTSPHAALYMTQKTWNICLNWIICSILHKLNHIFYFYIIIKINKIK